MKLKEILHITLSMIVAEYSTNSVDSSTDDQVEQTGGHTCRIIVTHIRFRLSL